ncbi:MAG: hypothetical protein AB1716_06255 [Planctomycetota bacterium]
MGTPNQRDFLPPYCPQYNCSERAWLNLHAAVPRNHRRRTMAHLLYNVFRYL